MKNIIFSFLICSVSALWASAPEEWNDPRYSVRVEESSKYTHYHINENHTFGTSIQEITWERRHFINTVINNLRPKFETYKSALNGGTDFETIYMLEVGAGPGFFTNYLMSALAENFSLAPQDTAKAQNKEFIKLIAVEPSQNPETQSKLDSVAKNAKPHIKILKSKNFLIDHLNSPRTTQNYDYVFMMFVSHFWNPTEWVENLARLNEKMKSGAMLLMSQNPLIDPGTPGTLIKKNQLKDDGDLFPDYYACFSQHLCNVLFRVFPHGERATLKNQYVSVQKILNQGDSQKMVLHEALKRYKMHTSKDTFTCNAISLNNLMKRFGFCAHEIDNRLQSFNLESIDHNGITRRVVFIGQKDQDIARDPLMAAARKAQGRNEKFHKSLENIDFETYRGSIGQLESALTVNYGHDEYADAFWAINDWVIKFLKINP